LDREHEPARRRRVPGGEVGRPLQRVERAVDLDRREALGRVAQLVALSQTTRVEGPAPACVVPAGDADEHPRHRPWRAAVVAAPFAVFRLTIPPTRYTGCVFGASSAGGGALRRARRRDPCSRLLSCETSAG